MPAPAITRRVRVLKLKRSAWDNPLVLEQMITAVLRPQERIVAVLPDPALTAVCIVTEE